MASSPIKIKQLNPYAAVVVWNYVDRVGTDGTSPSKVLRTEALPLVLTDKSVVSIRTSKSKGQPAGEFEMVLAPTENWVSHLTAGSWICILMCQHPISVLSKTIKADPTEVKLLGRIESVRVHVEVDQLSAARSTSFIVTGKDWGQIFECPLYIDPVARDGLDSAVGAAARILYEAFLKHSTVNEKSIPTSTDNIRALLDVWAIDASQFAQYDEQAKLLVKPQAVFSIPPQVTTFLGLTSSNDIPSVSVADLINVQSGIIEEDGSYKDIKESVGIVRPDGMYGGHAIWELLHDNCNDILNELLTDMSFSDGSATLNLYKRIKPFCVRDLPGDAGAVSGLVSKFTDIETAEIDIEDVVMVNAGTNWRDKFNYAEVLYDSSLIGDGWRDAMIKNQSTIFDENSYARDGFRPMIVRTKYLATKDNDSTDQDPYAVTNWKYLLKEWYFNTHNMLNGSVQIIGQDQYIQVGQNIKFDAVALSVSHNSNDGEPSAALSQFGNTFLLAHVENISHEFKVSPEGARSFFTTIQFVRGIIVDADNNPVGGLDDNGSVDNSSSMDPDDLRSHNVLVTKSTKSLL